MGTVRRQGLVLHTTEAGQGPHTVVLSHSYLLDSRHFAPQIEALAAAGFAVVAYDHRDLGQSGRATEPYDLEALVDDGLAVLDSIQGPVHWVGLSTGGFVGMRLAARHPERIAKLVLMDTSAEAEVGIKRARYEALMLGLKLIGLRPLVGQGYASLFGRTFRKDRSRAAEHALWKARIGENDPAALRRFGKAIFSRPDFVSELSTITAPTLVIVGEEDAATVPAKAQQIAAGIAGARLEIVGKAGHVCTIEQPDAVNALLLEFLGN